LHLGRKPTFIQAPEKILSRKANHQKWNLYWGRHGFVWNNEGDTATLFDHEGNKADSLEVVTLKAT
jgi:hypothetical protein